MTKTLYPHCFYYRHKSLGTKLVPFWKDTETASVFKRWAPSSECQVGKLTVSDLLDCIVECLKNALCLSINMAAFKGAEGKLWCELLSSDKYRDPRNYKENISSHHFSILVIAFSKCFFRIWTLTDRARFWFSVVLAVLFGFIYQNSVQTFPGL